LAVQEGVATRALASSGVTLEQARERVVRTVGRGEQSSAGAIPFTPRAKKLLVLALEEALNRDDDYIGTQHILLAVISEDEAVAAGILRGLGVDPEHVRRAVIETPSGAEDRPAAEEVQTAGRLAGGLAVTDDSGPRVTTEELDSETFGSAPELAKAFGSVHMAWSLTTHPQERPPRTSERSGGCALGLVHPICTPRRPSPALPPLWPVCKSTRSVPGASGGEGGERVAAVLSSDHVAEIRQPATGSGGDRLRRRARSR
jgi:hypothetical protein